MPKFGNNIKIVIIVCPIWENFIDIVSKKAKTK